MSECFINTNETFSQTFQMVTDIKELAVFSEVPQKNETRPNYAKTRNSDYHSLLSRTSQRNPSPHTGR